MKTLDQERLIYGAIYTQGKKYFLLEPEPKWKDTWMLDGTRKWLVAEDTMSTWIKDDDGEYTIPVYLSSTIIVGTNALIDLLPAPVVTKVIRFYVTDDEEA